MIRSGSGDFMKRISFFTLWVLISGTLLFAQFLDDKEIIIPEVKIFIEIIPTEIIGDEFTVFATYEIPENYHMFLNEELFNIYIDNIPNLISEKTIYPLDEAEELLGIPAFSHTVTLSRTFQLTDNLKSGDLNVEINAAYQICEDDGTCLLPESEIFQRTIILKKDTSISPFSGLLTILKFLLMAFIGGIILNIMPCVLPLLSVKALNLVEQSEHDKKVILKSSLLYALGILISFLALALTVIILKSSGELFGWGFQFQNPVFVLTLITIIFIFSLSLFDVFTLNAPQRGVIKASKYSAGKSYSGSFITGIFAVLVATPCTAPFMGAALGFAFSQTPLVIILIFSSLSLGFALPFVLLGLFPALIKKMPKPGKWMNTFKEFMGFLLLGTVIYLLTSLYGLIGSSIKGVLWFLLFTGLAVWIFGRFGSAIEKRIKRIISLFVTLLIITLSAMQFLNLNIVEKETVDRNDIWEEFSTELVEKYRAENIPVFIDFYADWCTSCKVNDATVLNTAKIRNMFDEYNVRLVKGDFTAGNREIAKWLAEYNRAGVPLYILFRPGEDAVVFPEILTRSMIEKELKLIKL